jgi:hypothetical protein
LVTVDRKGKVIDAEVEDNGTGLDARAAEDAASQWRFKPQFFDDNPIIAVGEITLDIRPLEISPDPLVAFPSAGPQDVEISLDRTSCFGLCPDNSWIDQRRWQSQVFRAA